MKVYILSPSQLGSVFSVTTGVILLPHTSVTTGAVGNTASAIHSTVAVALAGTTGSVVISMVYVNV